MKEKHLAFVVALGASQLISLIWLTLFWLGFSASILGDIEQILITVLRLDSILLGFTDTLFSFLLSRIESRFTKYAFMFGTTAFVLFFFSILFGLIGLLRKKE